MPHYADGTEAKVGDQVTGQLYNTPGIRAGTVISITPDAETCNALVAYIEPVLLNGDLERWQDLQRPGHWTPMLVLADGKTPGQMVPRMAAYRDGENPAPMYRVVRGEQHGAAGPYYALFECQDYCAINELTKVASKP